MRRLPSIIFAFILVSGVIISSGAQADPCLVVYPDIGCIYRYDPAEYYTVGPGHPLYDPVYDRGGEVLLEVGTNEVDLSIYQAPGLEGFEPSYDGDHGYYFAETVFTLVVDGFSNQPTTFVNVLIVFDKFDPDACQPEIWVDGQLVGDYVHEAGDLVVSTPTLEGNNYSDTMTFSVTWQGCYGIHMWAFADEDYNGVKDGGECFTAFSHDIFIPVGNSTWGAVKSLYE